MQTPEPQITTFTADQINRWLNQGETIPGLTQAVIAPARAWAILHNPYIKPEDHVAATLHLNNPDGTQNLVAYTAAFPEIIQNRRMWWFSTLWCHPAHLGKGYALAVIGTLAELYGPENCLDTMGAQETVSIFRYLGHDDTTLPEYHFGSKITPQNFKGRLANILEKTKTSIRTFRIKHNKQLNTPRYNIEYTDHIDDNTYQFITSHATNQLFIRTQPTLNWILAHPFKHYSPLSSKTTSRGLFGQTDTLYRIIAAKIYIENKLTAFYILRNSETDLSVKYLYYDSQHTQTVFNSIIHHIASIKNTAFSTRSKQLAQYITQQHLFNKKKTVQISFSYPKEYTLPLNAESQGGDGDCFV